MSSWTKGAAPDIPSKVTRVWKNCFLPFLYRGRDAIERMFNRLKDFHRIATRYDRIAINFHAAVCIAAAASYGSQPQVRNTARAETLGAG